MSKYVLATEVLSIDTRVELTATEFSDYKQAWQTATECLAIEETFSYVIYDMLELEAAIHRHALDGVCNPFGDWSVAMDRLHDVSRRLVHLLSSSHAYLDSTGRRLSASLPKDHPAISQWEGWRNQMSDGSKEALIWKRLRDLALHQDNPLSGLFARGRLASPLGVSPVLIERTFALNINHSIRSAESSRRHKKRGHRRTLQPPLDDLPEKFDVRPLVQDYVASLGETHQSLRIAVASDCKRAACLMQEAVRRFAEKLGKPPEQVYVVLAEVDANGQFEVRVPMGSQWSDRYEVLLKRYVGVPSLRGSYLTTRSTLGTMLS
jgi:hypothetical protein